MTFPNAHSWIYYNEAGEVLGWDNPSYDEPPDPDEFEDDFDYDLDDEEEND